MNTVTNFKKKKSYRWTTTCTPKAKKNFVRTQSSNLVIAENALGKKEVFPATFPGECHNNVNKEALRIQI